jgi:hypothetical protein
MSVFPLILFCIKHLTEPVDFNDSLNRIPFFRIRKRRRKENFRPAAFYTVPRFFNRFRKNIIGNGCGRDGFTVVQKSFLIFFNLNNHIVSVFDGGPESFFLTVKGVESKNTVGKTEFFDQLPRGRNFVAFLFNFFMTENDAATAGESAQDLNRFNIIKLIVTAPKSFSVAMNKCSVPLTFRKEPAGRTGGEENNCSAESA